MKSKRGLRGSSDVGVPVERSDLELDFEHEWNAMKVKTKGHCFRLQVQVQVCLVGAHMVPSSACMATLSSLQLTTRRRRYR